MLASRPLGSDQSLNMGVVFNLLSFVIGAKVNRNLIATTEESNLLGRGHQQQGRLHIGVGDGVVILVESHIGGFTHFDLNPFIGGVLMLRERNQSGLLFGKGLGHTHRSILRAGSGHCCLIAPLPSLLIKII